MKSNIFIILLTLLLASANAHADYSGAIQLPVGPSTARPSQAATGMIRYNSTLSIPEIFSSHAWKSFSGFAPGSNTDVIYNSSGVTAANSGFTYDGSGNASLSTSLVVGSLFANPGSSLDLSNTTNSFLLPTGSTGQRPSPTAGMIRYNSTIPAIEAYYGGVWNSLGGATSAGAYTIYGNNTGSTGAPAFNTVVRASGPIVCGAQTVTISGAAIATNYSLGCKLYATLSHLATTAISNPTNPIDGGKLLYALTQDGTGSNIVTWDTAFDFGISGAPVLSTAAAAVDYIGFSYDANLSKWVYLGGEFGN